MPHTPKRYRSRSLQNLASGRRARVFGSFFGHLIAYIRRQRVHYSLKTLYESGKHFGQDLNVQDKKGSKILYVCRR